MLQIQHIRKEYRTGKLVQKALDDVSLNLRDSEFVAILGPSGSGKTTLLNIIGGLDRYDSGDLIINGISTKKYKDRDWDSYRNHTIGFVFQSYNLIPHQTVLSNVELALTISGISRSERRKRAIDALEKVGLGEQIHKRPSQMSGGQMQRVAIARALVNNPDILLADEPTGALDSDTSVQVMELLKEVSKDRLVVMVTHNPELAYEYATRIVEVKDGKILSDSDPLDISEEITEEPVHKNMGKSSMSFLTALSLSFQNLKTKKARTLLTSFAGSIGIIGIALILSISNGVSGYIKAMEEDTLSEYPLQIQSTGFDLTAMMVSASVDSSDNKKDNDIGVTPAVTNMFSKMSTNDLAALKTHLESNPENIDNYVHAIEYSYVVTPQIYRSDKNDTYKQINPDKSYEMVGMSSSYENSMTSSMSTNVFYELPANSDLYSGQYEVKAGHWPESYNECVLVLNSNGNISDRLEYTLGLRDSTEYENMVSAFMSEKEIDVPENNDSFSYDDLLGMTFKVVNSADYYEYDSEYDIWKDKTGNDAYMKDLVSLGEDLKITGIVQQIDGTAAAMLTPGIGYTQNLTKHLIQYAASSDIVKAQKDNKDTNIFTGEKFGTDSQDNKFNMESLFQIDADAMSNAFKVDDSIYNMDMSDISSLINLDDISAGFDASMFDSDAFDSSMFDDISFGDMSDIMGDGSFDMGSMDADAIKKFITDSLNDEVKADINSMLSGFKEYILSDGVSAKLGADIKQLITDSVQVNISQDRVLQEVNKLEEKYFEYVKNNGIEDTSADSVFKFLLTDEARQQITASAKDIMSDAVVIDISYEQLWNIFQRDVADGFVEYAKQNGYPDVDGILDKVITNMINSLQEQITAGIEASMNKMMSSITLNMQQAMEQVMTQMMSSMTEAMVNAMQLMGNNMTNAFGLAGTGSDMDSYDFGSAFGIDTESFADAIKMNMNEDDLSDLMMSLMSNTDTASYDNNMKKLGYADLAVPSGIDIYPKDFESKDQIVKILDNYNNDMKRQGKDAQVISYTDVVGTLMSSVTTIVNVISYVLIAFVAISLVVSSIMIGVITYISVLERRKEIGILRAIGASKKNVSAVFNAETCIIGLCAGLMGIGITLLMLIPINAIIHAVSGVNNINAVLPVAPAIVLILLSIFLTFIGGLIPSKKASKSDPVAALRNE